VRRTTMAAAMNALDMDLIEVAPESSKDELQAQWFSERRFSSIPPERRSSVPPMGDDEVDRWLR
jgi:hypothetical protein